MSLYSTSKEMYTDVKKDKPMLILLRILMGILIIFVAIVTIKAFYAPVKIFGIELNSHLIRHDTVTLTIRDTVFVLSTNAPPDEARTANKKNATTVEVKSIHQKGGQTANEITNNNK